MWYSNFSHQSWVSWSAGKIYLDNFIIGTYWSSNYWINCSAGYYQPAIEQTLCIQCPAGTYSSAGAALCTNWAAGTYSSLGASSCTQCSAGYYSVSSGSSVCTICPAGSYSSVGATSCTQCSSNTYASSAGSNSWTNWDFGMFSISGSSSCNAIWGDGIKAPIEGWDDNNLLNGDGWSNSWTIELGYVCSETPSTSSSVWNTSWGDGIRAGIYYLYSLVSILNLI